MGKPDCCLLQLVCLSWLICACSSLLRAAPSGSQASPAPSTVSSLWMDRDLPDHQDNIARALEISELARARALRDLLATRETPSLSQPIGPIPPLLQQPLPTREKAIQEALKNLPPLVSNVQAEQFHAEEARLAAADGPVLSYYQLGDSFVIFVIEPTGNFHAARTTLSSHALSELIHRTRKEIRSPGDAAILRRDLRRLYDALLAPVARWLVPTRPSIFTPPTDQAQILPTAFRNHNILHPASWMPGPSLLTIIPSGELYLVPFAALIARDGSYLVQLYALRMAPSLTVLRYTRAQAARLHGVPTLAAFYSAPGSSSGKEVKQVASILAAGDRTAIIHTGKDATETTFREEAPRATDIYLAGPTYIARDPLRAAIVLAPAPGITPAYQRDGYLTVSEIFNLKLKCRLVTLSGDDTALGTIGADGVLGLQSAFLAAGASSLLSSLWNIHRDATTELMKQFYRSLQADPQHNRALALQAAQIHLLRSSQYREPRYWAGFILTGEARG